MAYIGQSIKNGTFSVLDTSGNTYNGSNTTFNLGTQVGAAAQLLVSHDGVIQKPGTDYTLATGGTQITFTTAPASGASIFIVEISGAVGGTITPVDGSVTADKLNTAILTGQTDIGGAIADADLFLLDDGAGGTLRKTAASRIKTYIGAETNTPAFSARESGQQTINHNTTTNLTFGTEEVDTDSAFASNIFTVPSGEGGKYFLAAQLNLYDADSNITQGTLWIWKGSNSTKLSNLYTQTDDGANTSHRSLHVSVIADLSASDTVGAACILNTSDSGTATSYGGDNGTRIIGFKLAGA